MKVQVKASKTKKSNQYRKRVTVVLARRGLLWQARYSGGPRRRPARNQAQEAAPRGPEVRKLLVRLPMEVSMPRDAKSPGTWRQSHFSFDDEQFSHMDSGPEAWFEHEDFEPIISYESAGSSNKGKFCAYHIKKDSAYQAKSEQEDAHPEGETQEQLVDELFCRIDEMVAGCGAASADDHEEVFVGELEEAFEHALMMEIAEAQEAAFEEALAEAVTDATWEDPDDEPVCEYIADTGSPEILPEAEEATDLAPEPEDEPCPEVETEADNSVLESDDDAESEEDIPEMFIQPGYDDFFAAALEEEGEYFFQGPVEEIAYETADAADVVFTSMDDIPLDDIFEEVFQGVAAQAPPAAEERISACDNDAVYGEIETISNVDISSDDVNTLSSMGIDPIVFFNGTAAVSYDPGSLAQTEFSYPKYEQEQLLTNIQEISDDFRASRRLWS